MKLRLRSLETKDTIRVEIPFQSTLQHLHQTLSQSLSLPYPSSLYFSLNRKDSLHASSPHHLLSSLGITSGDLIYFSLNPTSFSPPLTQIPISQETLTLESTNLELPRLKESDIPQGSRVFGVVDQIQETPVQHFTVQRSFGSQEYQLLIGKESEISQDSQVVGVVHQNQETPVQDFAMQKPSDTHMADTNLDSQEFSGTEAMNIDDSKKFSEPYFLRRVLREELGFYGSDHKLLVIAVHAVLLESGFVGFDSASGLRVDRFHMPDGFSSRAFTVSLCYTLPELLGNVDKECVVLKFQSLGHFVNVYGSLAKGKSSLYRVCLDEYRFAPTIDLLWAKCDKNDKMDDTDGSSNTYPENEVFEFWKIVKDGLALPLMIDLCDRTGLDLPACLMGLPTELKLKILESLPGVDVARIGCVSSEMRYLSSNNDLWKQKFAEEFGDDMGSLLFASWKQSFACSWESRKKRKRAITPWQGFPRVDRHFYLPGLVIPFPFGQPGRAFPRRTFSPPCNLGGFNA
ncbi:F-box domain-containing protein/UN_NPL4 domain-containing protein [Cephalotus follicularis]|uniref:F-box domain-containing protein/UN_NPL4 domain-containing protein n=1 Tax=Cephalotus follicularis TaxID=3775 RepID=A0A1Q3CEY4_CEPFO|nr:F-box domain-containing protein/UN_NPL4 domain-containing protein [Cephalotus follicularis]